MFANPAPGEGEKLDVRNLAKASAQRSLTALLTPAGPPITFGNYILEYLERKRMRKSAELEGPSCITKAWDNEMIFVLLARDEAAPVAIGAWIAERIRIGKNQPKDAQIIEAQQCADVMRGQREPLREAIQMVDRFNHRDSSI